MKRLVFQVNIDPKDNKHKTGRTYHHIADLYKLSEQQARKYAEKCNSDYKQITDCSFLPNKHPIYQKLALLDFTEYDQILYVDSDAVILDSCPNLFELYKDSEFCAVHDYDFTSTSEYTKKMRNSLLKMYDADESYNPFCSGVMLFSKNILPKIKNIYEKYLDSFTSQHDQGIFNRCIVELNIDYTELSSDYGAWYRKGKHIIHLAGHKKKEFDLQKFCKKNQI